MSSTRAQGGQRNSMGTGLSLVAVLMDPAPVSLFRWSKRRSRSAPWPRTPLVHTRGPGPSLITAMLTVASAAVQPAPWGCVLAMRCVTACAAMLVHGICEYACTRRSHCAFLWANVGTCRVVHGRVIKRGSALMPRYARDVYIAGRCHRPMSIGSTNDVVSNLPRVRIPPFPAMS